MFKRIIPAILSISILLAGSVPALAAETSVKVDDNDITVEETFTSNTSDFNYQFDEKITQDGKKYKLKGVNYQTVGVEDLTETQPVTHKVDYHDLYKQDLSPDDTLIITQNGNNVEVKLKGVTYSDTVIQNRTATLTAYTDYSYTTVTPRPAATKTITYYDEATGQNLTRTLQFKELKAEDGWAWRADLTIPMTFAFYDSEYYVLGDKYVPYNDEKPALEGYETDLLNELDLDINKYRITSVEWDGEEYQAGDITYRKAIAHGDRYTANYVAYYESTVNLPDAAGYNAVAEYEGQATALTGEKEYTVLATAVYTPDNTTALIVAGVVGGLIIIVLLVIAILYVLSQKRKKRGEF